jgi:hypothetical protein
LPPSLKLADGVFGELAFEGEWNPTTMSCFWDAHFTSSADVVFGAVMLEPNFAVFDV